MTTPHQLAKDILALAATGGMPDSFWQTDSRIARACQTLGINPEEGREAAQEGTLESLDAPNQKLIVLNTNTKKEQIKALLEEGYTISKGEITLKKEKNEEHPDFPYHVDVSQTPLKGYDCGGEFSNVELAWDCFLRKIENLREHHQQKAKAL